MNLDFSFQDGTGRTVLAGWDADPGPLLLQVEDADGNRLPVTVLPRFARADLGTEDALAVLAVAPPGAMPVALLDAAGNRTALDPEAMAQGAAALIAAGLDETFAALLRAIAMSQIGPIRPEAVARLMDRTRATATPLPAHHARIAAAADKTMLAPGGLGFVTGWVLTDDGAEAPLVGLVSDGTSVAPVAINTGTLSRGDLAGYRDRYALTGVDGFQAVFRLAASGGTRPVQLLLLPRRASHGFGLMTVPLDRAAGAAVTAAISTALRGLPHEAARALITTLALESGPAMAPLPASTPTDAGSALLLIPDTEPGELRDILRWLLPHLAPPVLVIPLADTLPGTATAALQAAVAEDGGDVRLAPPCPVADMPALTLPAGAEVIAGSAAALFQLGPPQSVPDTAAARVYDPLGALEPASGLRAAALGDLPFTLRLPADLLTPALAALPRGLLSAEGSLAAAMAALDDAGRLGIEHAQTGAFWPGPQSGVAAARLDAVLRGMGAEA